MMTAKLFENGRSQAKTRLIARSDRPEIVLEALQNGADAVILLPKNNRWSGFLTSLDMFTADFMPNGREQPDAQGRESL